MRQGLIFIMCFISLNFLGLVEGLGQNLVLNPGFEENTYVFIEPFERGPNSKDCMFWNTNAGYGLLCTSCQNDNFLPNTKYGYQFPRSGKACISRLLTWANSQKDQRQRLYGNLSKPLTKDSLYKVSFFINLGGLRYYSEAEQRVAYLCVAVNRMGAYVGNAMQVNFDTSLVQIQNDPGRLLDDTSGWMEISGIIRAVGGEKFITISNFWNDKTTRTKLIAPKDDFSQGTWGSTYFIDDVSVIQIINPNLGKDTSLCSGSKIVLKSNGTKSDSLIWQNGSRADSFIATQPGTYYVEAWHGGYKLRDTIHISSTYSISLGEDKKLCEGEKYTFTLPEDSANYQWPDGSTGNTFTVNQAGTYWVKAQKAVCIVYDSATITFQEPLSTYSLPKDTTICENRNLTIDLAYTDAAILWEDGSVNKEYTIRKAGTYKLLLKNACGSLNHTFQVKEENCICDVFVPNAFTPDYNAVNDFFTAYSDCVFTSYNLSVYNRWGVQVFSTDDITQGWDGKYKGKKCAPNMYIYVISANADNDQSFHKRGLFMLLD